MSERLGQTGNESVASYIVDGKGPIRRHFSKHWGKWLTGAFGIVTVAGITAGSIASSRAEERADREFAEQVDNDRQRMVGVLASANHTRVVPGDTDVLLDGTPGAYEDIDFFGRDNNRSRGAQGQRRHGSFADDDHFPESGVAFISAGQCVTERLDVDSSGLGPEIDIVHTGLDGAVRGTYDQRTFMACNMLSIDGVTVVLTVVNPTD